MRGGEGENHNPPSPPLFLLSLPTWSHVSFPSLCTVLMPDVSSISVGISVTPVTMVPL